MFKHQFKTLFVLMLLCVVVSAAVSISTDKSEYYCDDEFNCEVVNINILKTGTPLSEKVHLRIDYDNSNGAIFDIKNFFRHNWKKRYELTNPFDLPNGNKYFDMEFKATGSGKFNISVIGADTGIVYYVLDPYWSLYDLNDFTYLQSTNNALHSFNIDPNGQYIISTHSSEDKFKLWEMTTPWNISTITYLSDFSTTGEDSYGFKAIYVSKNGTYLYGTGLHTNRIYQYTLSTPWNVSTATANGYLTLSGTQNGNSLSLSDDGTLMQKMGTQVYQNNVYLEEYNLSTPWDITTATPTSTNLLIGYSFNSYFKHRMSPDGKTLFTSYEASMSSTASISQHSLPGAWNISSKSTITTRSLNKPDPYEYVFIETNPLGTQMYISGYNSTFITRQYEIDELNPITIQSPNESEEITTYSSYLNFTVPLQNLNYSIYQDGIFNSTVNVTSGDKTYSKLMTIFTEGNHNFTIVMDAIPEINNTVNFNVELITINKPLQGQQLAGPDIVLDFNSSAYTPGNFTIYIDGIENKTIELLSGNHQESFILTNGNHNFTIKNTLLGENKSVSFEVVDYALDSWDYESSVNEVDSTTIIALYKHKTNEKTSSATLNYNGTEYSMDVTYLNSTHDQLTKTIITQFITEDVSSVNNWFFVEATSNASTIFTTSNQTQVVNQAYYITSIELPSTGIEGEEVIGNLTIINNADFAIVNVYFNSTNLGELLATQLTFGTTQNWTRTFNLPAVSTPTIKTIQSYITVTYGGETSYRYFNDTNITVSPVSIGICGGVYTIPILNYSAWDEKNNSLQITTNNFWETKIIARAPGGSVNTTLGFTGTGSTHSICLENNATVILDVSTWLSNDPTKYVRRSYFIQNTAYSNESETDYIRIHLLNISDASVVDFIVKDAFDTPQANRIIKFFKFDAINETYKEMFNLKTDLNGKAIGYVEAFDQWYKIVDVNSDNVITKTIPSTQFSTATYTIVEVSTEFGQLEGITWIAQWNNASKVFSLSIVSDISRTFKLETIELGIFANTTYCTDTFHGSSGVLYCDLSGVSVDQFRWILSYQGEDVIGNTIWVPITSSIIEQPSTPAYGLAGLILTGFLLIIGVTIYLRDARVIFMMVAIMLTISRAFGIYEVNYFAIMSTWAVAIALLYILRGEKS